MKTEIPSQQDNPTGLHGRYYIQKIVLTRSENFFGEYDTELRPVDPDAEYFVMRLDEGGKDIEHIKACRIGINAYADAIYEHLPDLAIDLRERYPLL